MAFDLASISKGKAKRAPRVVLAGTQKIGKSTWAAGAPDAIFLPIRGEEGIDEIDAAKFPVAQSLADVMSAMETLYTEPHDFQTLIIDSLSTLEPLIWDATCAAHGLQPGQIEQVLGGFGKGYIESLKWWGDLLGGLDALRETRGMGCVLITHVKVKAFNDPLAAAPYDQYQIDLQEKAAHKLERWADATLFANRKAIAQVAAKKGKGANAVEVVHAKTDGVRRVYTEKTPAHPGGTRYRGMPYELPDFTYAAFAAEVEKSRE
jgi:hypothetical protein